MTYTEAMTNIKANKNIKERYHPDISDAILNFLEFGGDSADTAYFLELTDLDITKIVKG